MPEEGAKMIVDIRKDIGQRVTNWKTMRSRAARNLFKATQKSWN